MGGQMDKWINEWMKSCIMWHIYMSRKGKPLPYNLGNILIIFLFFIWNFNKADLKKVTGDRFQVFFLTTPENETADAAGSWLVIITEAYFEQGQWEAFISSVNCREALSPQRSTPLKAAQGYKHNAGWGFDRMLWTSKMCNARDQ